MSDQKTYCLVLNGKNFRLALPAELVKSVSYSGKSWSTIHLKGGGTIALKRSDVVGHYIEACNGV